ncbi:MAG: hypothetical protein JWP91_4586 [Fibrobacteres bacterium]|nr:hypothetical protein [Fibrobacterota bacterium]
MDNPPGGPLIRSRPSIFRRCLISAALSLSAIASMPLEADAARCGTAMLFEPGRGLHPAFKTGALAARVAAVDNRARTLESDNFLIHYSLRAWHRVHTEPGDSALVRAADSLFTLLASLPDGPRDSAVYARLDSAHYPHPAYILKTRDYFESARAYYVGTLGMLPPSSSALSVQYNVSPSLNRKFPVDVVDVGTVDSFFAGETYAVTYPPPDLSIAFENDFICRTSLDANGRIRGDSIKSRLSGEVIHNYAAEWELGIKVTAFHEFYHAVQFTYIPRVTTYHAWYEISATGMEERNAGEVNDYLQYLPCVLYNHERIPLTSTLQGPCTHYPMYGQAIFHQYLSKALDSAFDVRVWDQLRRNGDALKDGLETAFAKYGQSMATLYPDYASQVFFAGKRFRPPGPSFTSDIPLWPNISMDSVDLSSAAADRVITLPVLTFGVLKVKWGPKAYARTLQAKVASGITRIHASADTSIVEHLLETRIALGPPRDGFDAYYLVLPNPSYTEKATVEIKESDAQFYAYPNPVRTLAPATLYFSQGRDMAFPSQVRIYGENGRLVRTLEFTSPDQSMTWDLHDAGNQTVKPGLYYYRLAQESLKVLVVLR